ncbi:MAG TPA: DUF1887 family protein [Firmicutes bacterium]|nr:DUF1887 family protein [Bacillota bacterium]
MARVQFMLVGGRLPPNIIGATLLRPDTVGVVASKDAVEEVGLLEEALRNMVGPPEWVRVVDPHDYDVNVGICEEFTRQYSHGNELYFNITCGTKIMAMAAYEAARRCPEARVFYVDTAGRRIIWLVGRGEAVGSFRISIADYLAAYGREAMRKPVFETLTFGKEQALTAAALLARDRERSVPFLERVRKSQGNYPCTVHARADGEQSLMNDLARLGLIDVVSQDRFVIRSNEDWNFFKGDWLEIFVWDQARRLQEPDGQATFDEVEIGLEIPSGEATKEIDVACLRDGRLIHCSCKTGGDAFNTAPLDELAAVSSLIGGRYCTRVFVTHRRLGDVDERRKQKFREQARQREIVVIAGEELVDVGAILKKQINNPDFRNV